MLIERIATMWLMPAAERKTRFVLHGDDGLFDRRSRPHRTRTTLNALLRELKKSGYAVTELPRESRRLVGVSHAVAGDSAM